MGPAVGQGCECGEQMPEDPLDVPPHIRICESNGGIAQMLMALISKRIPLRIVRIAIHFNDQALLGAEEVNDAMIDDMLPAEFVTTKLGSADVTPELGLKWSHCVSQTLRPFKQMRLLRQTLPHTLPLP